MGRGILIWLVVAFLFCLQAEEEGPSCPRLLEKPSKAKTLSELRSSAIRSWDRLLTWTLSPLNFPYALIDPPKRDKVSIGSKALDDFDVHYGYFSIYRPLVGVGTQDFEDIQRTGCLLEALHREELEASTLQFATNQVLAKVLAYRGLKAGMRLSFAAPDGNLETYIVDTVIDIWKGMPAFGLVPERQGAVPILLFRGTDLNLTSDGGWASVLSDLDPAGPGLSAFLIGRDKVRDWLKKMELTHQKARAVGFSLGGVFVLYTLIFEGDLLSQKFPSIAFNPPGVSQEILTKWHALKEEDRPPQITYVNRGDVVSKVGLFFSDVSEISVARPMQVIESHVTLVGALHPFEMAAVNVERENELRKERFIAQAPSLEK